MSDKERTELIAVLVLLWLQGDLDTFAARLSAVVMTGEALSALSEQMQQARTDAYLSVYEQDANQLFETFLPELQVYASRSADAELPVGQSAMLDDVQADVNSIAHTWEDTISAQVEKWDVEESLSALTASLHTTLSEKAEAKAQQVANVTVQKATDAAQRQFVSDTLVHSRVWVVNEQGDLETRELVYVEQENPDNLFDRLAQMLVAVLPEESSGDFCKEYAGKTYSADDLDFLPYFPAHPGCIHQVELMYSS